jgi:hypothetical protein
VVGKEKGPFIPTNDTVLEADDDVVAITSSDNEEAMRAMLVGKQSPA